MCRSAAFVSKKGFKTSLYTRRGHEHVPRSEFEELRPEFTDSQLALMESRFRLNESIKAMKHSVSRMRESMKRLKESISRFIVSMDDRRYFGLGWEKLRMRWLLVIDRLEAFELHP
jgi:3-oxoacyl-[acyl-carrier-protein] synthase III